MLMKPPEKTSRTSTLLQRLAVVPGDKSRDLSQPCQPSGLVFLLVVCLVVGFATPAHAFHILFKDGFSITGRIRQARKYLVDRVSGRAFSVPVSGTPYAIETPARRIIFSPRQVYDITAEEPPTTPLWMYMEQYGRKGGVRLSSYWTIKATGPWDDRWERKIRLKELVGNRFSSNFRTYTLTQRITQLTPSFLTIRCMDRSWAMFYRMEEFDSNSVQQLLNLRFQRTEQLKSKKDGKEFKFSDAEKHLKVAQFLTQMGRYDDAKKGLEKYKGGGSGANEDYAQEFEAIKKFQALKFVTSLLQAEQVGQHQIAQQRIDKFLQDNLEPLVTEKLALNVYELKRKYSRLNEKVKTAKRQLTEFAARLTSKNRGRLGDAAKTIANEVNVETVNQLETFLNVARVHELAREQGREPDHDPAQVLSFAVTGWCVGDLVAEGDVLVADRFWDARTFVLEYQKTGRETERAKLLRDFRLRNQIPVDVLARLVEATPPPFPHDKLDTSVQELQVTEPDGAQGPKYHVQLPPGYNHQRSYPVLMVLHEPGHSPPFLMKYWSDLAQKNGYILVAPEWTRFGQTTYEYSEREQLVVIDTIRDLRRRFQIDSDRVFLFGCREAGQMAFDVGLGHPDMFAGVLPMSASPQYYSSEYTYNAQYLPLYVVCGQLDLANTNQNHKKFKDWVRWHFPSLFVEYKGRGVEFFYGEFGDMMDWMNRKTRYFPKRQVGTYGFGNRGSEFVSMRQSDNSFYWLTSESIVKTRLNDVGNWRKALQPAQFHAKIYSRNKIHLNTAGLNHLAIWIAPGMIDFSQKIKLRLRSNPITRYRGQILVNGEPPQLEMDLEPKLEVLMEDLYNRGDRQKLFIAKIELTTARRGG
ncbi:MAG: hypothetical protein ACFCD0_29525 [Gemmataceae bacterium]